MATTTEFKKGRVEKLPLIRPGRPNQRTSYRQRFFAELDRLHVNDYLEIDAEDRDKATAYCYQKNAIDQDRRFVTSITESGKTRIFREN